MEASNHEIDHELIAAFIDGRLSGADRARAMKLLAESEAAFEVYSDALRVRADLDDRGVVSIAAARRRRGHRGWWGVVPLAAAAALLFAIVPRMGSGVGDGALSAPSAVLARPLTARADLAAALGGDWSTRTWSVSRGGSTGAVDSATAFRLGARAVDLYVALAVDDRQRVGQLSGEMLGALSQLTLSDAAAAEYSALRAQLTGGESREQLLAQAARAEVAMEQRLGSSWFGFGRWCAAGELAAAARSADFFTSDVTADFLESADESRTFAPADTEALRRVADLARKGVTGGEFDAIRQILQTLISRHGG